MDTLACSIDHLGVVKFYAIRIETMEAYQLWWNKGTFWEMLRFDNSQNQSLNNRELLQGGGLDFESRQRLITFR